MGKEDFISGTILEFKVPIDLGYAYCKILDYRQIREFDGVLVRVFDHIVKHPLKDITVLSEKDWLFGARRMPWLPGTRGKGAWKFKGILISEEDNIIPDFKYCIKSSAFVEDESKLEPWDVVRNINSYIPSEYGKVKHLENTAVSARPGIAIRTAMEYCRIHQMEIEKYFDLSDTVNLIVYRQMCHVPIYKSIPREIRGKAIL